MIDSTLENWQRMELLEDVLERLATDPSDFWDIRHEAVNAFIPVYQSDKVRYWQEANFPLAEDYGMEPFSSNKAFEIMEVGLFACADDYLEQMFDEHNVDLDSNTTEMREYALGVVQQELLKYGISPKYDRLENNVRG